jgi:succinate-acetate transporter protein
VAEVRIVVRPYASALPLGFFSFGIGMLLLGGFANGWIHPSERHTLGLLLALFVFPLEGLCAVFAFLARDTFGATGLGLFTTSWLALGVADMRSSQTSVSHIVGLYEFGFAFAIVLLALAALSSKPLIGVIMLTASVRSTFAGVHEWAGPASLWTTAGWLGVAIFAMAMYGGIAFLLEDTQKRQLLPVFRLGSSKEAFEGDLRGQLEQLDTEAGVRQVL